MLDATLDATPLQLEDGWRIASPGEAYLDEQLLSELTRWIEQSYAYHRTHAVLIEHAGRLVYELYLEGDDIKAYGSWEHRTFDADSLHDLRSVSKSVTSLLLGLALGDDYRKALATPVTEFFKNEGIAFGEGAEAVTLGHVLTMTAGFEWDEWTIPYSDPGNDERRLAHAADPIAFILGRPVKDPPGSVWEYSAGLTELLGAIIEHKTGKRLDSFAAQALFEPLGITRFEWLGSKYWKSQDRPQGRPSAAAGLRMRARDLAKLGSLVLHDGVWNNQQIVPAEWVRLCGLRHVEKVGRFSRAGGSYGYGFQWWVGRSNSIPSYDIIGWFGNGGQQVLVVPEHHLVVTIFAGNYGRYGQGLFNWMLGRIVPGHKNHE